VLAEAESEIAFFNVTGKLTAFAGTTCGLHRGAVAKGRICREMSHVSGLQAAQVGLVRLLETWRQQFSPREFAVLLDLLVRWLEREAPRS
jgi:hypothetical protein